MYRMCTVCTVLSYVHLIILAPFLLRTGPWTAISPAGIQLVYTVASKDKSSCILQKLKTVFVCPRQRWKVTVVLLRSIVRNLQMALFLFLTSAIMQMCIFIRLSVVLSSVSWWCYFYACVSKCLCWIYCGVFFWLVVPFLACQMIWQTKNGTMIWQYGSIMKVLSLCYPNVLEAVISKW